ncbi:MAG: class II glutamine amidotransferase [Alphaproteobacteria bacterium]
MCRWLAYSGPPIYLEDVIFKPENSLIRQSRDARHSVQPTNGDGFGLGWYAGRTVPGLFRDVRPAWNDDNLLSLAEQIRSPLFFAHVRATTGTSTARANCHPFRVGRWLFMHNGQIAGYEELRRRIDFLIPASLYRYRRGITDSEAIFLLLLANGLEDDPGRAFGTVLALIGEVMREEGVSGPLRVTAAATDGQKIIAVRYANDGDGPTLYYGHACSEAEIIGAPGGVLVLSEPLDSIQGNWNEVGASSLLVAGDGAVVVRPLALH